MRAILVLFNILLENDLSRKQRGNVLLSSVYQDEAIRLWLSKGYWQRKLWKGPDLTLIRLFYYFSPTFNHSVSFHRCCWQNIENTEDTTQWRFFRKRWSSKGKRSSTRLSSNLSVDLFALLIYQSVCLCSAAEACDGWEERTPEGAAASVPGGPSFLLPNCKHALFRPGLRQRRRGAFSKSLEWNHKPYESSCMCIWAPSKGRNPCLWSSICHVLSSSTTSRGRVPFLSPELCSMQQRWLWHWATCTPSALFTGTRSI